MTFEAWAGLIGRLVVEMDPALRDCMVEGESRNEVVDDRAAADHLEQRTWQTPPGFVTTYRGEDDDRPRVHFVKMVWPPLPFVRLDGGQAFRAYDRSELGANLAAVEIAAFLMHGTLPETLPGLA